MNLPNTLMPPDYEIGSAIISQPMPKSYEQFKNKPYKKLTASLCAPIIKCFLLKEVRMDELTRQVQRRRTFAIISHPDAGKTTLTEKLLLYGGAIRQAGSVKARKADRHATSDWMEIEKQRGISVTSSAMQFSFEGYHINI
jgi:hypothetical protein